VVVVVGLIAVWGFAALCVVMWACCGPRARELRALRRELRTLDAKLRARDTFILRLRGRVAPHCARENDAHMALIVTDEINNFYRQQARRRGDRPRPLTGPETPLRPPGVRR
jgi:hypothetical protein